MATSAYASALGRLRPEFPAFLPKEIYPTLLGARDVNEIAKILETTAYGPDVQQARATHQGSGLVEIAVNRTFVRRNRHAYDATPFAGRGVVGAYLTRYDRENIELILGSKAWGRPISETDEQLISSREIPAGLYAGVLTLDDYRILLAQPSLEATVAQLVKFGYGGALLPLLEQFERSHDIFPVVLALDRDYYAQVREAAKFFQGDEWVVRQFIASEIDVRNALLLLKGKAADLSVDDVLARWIEGGTLASTQAPDLYGARGVPELAERLADRYPSIAEGNDAFRADASVAGYEVAATRDRAVFELKRMKTYPLSLSVIFSYLLLAELERADVRRVTYGKMYEVPNDRLEPLLVSPRL